MIVVTGTTFNIIGNYVLGFGKFGFPQLGLAGLGVARVIALYVFKNQNLRKYRIFQELHRVRLRILWELTRIIFWLRNRIFLVITFWTGTLGTEVLAAHQVVFQTIIVLFMVPLGSSYATTVRVGQ